MTRPVAEILEQAQRERWPTSSIDAMANHHLCGLARDYVNDCFEPGALGSKTGALADPHQGAAPPLRTAGAASAQQVEKECSRMMSSSCPVCGGDHGDGMICTPWRRVQAGANED